MIAKDHLIQRVRSEKTPTLERESVLVELHEGDEMIVFFFAQLARHSKVLQQSLKPGSGSLFDPDNEKDDALHYYANHTAQIEVRLTSS